MLETRIFPESCLVPLVVQTRTPVLQVGGQRTHVASFACCLNEGFSVFFLIFCLTLTRSRPLRVALLGYHNQALRQVTFWMNFGHIFLDVKWSDSLESHRVGAVSVLYLTEEGSLSSRPSGCEVGESPEV